MTRRRIDPLSLVRPHLLELAPYEAVDPPERLAKRAGIPVDRVVKLDANENPYGPSPKALAAIASLDNVHVYPDPRQTEAREAVARYVGIGAGHVVIGNGSDEIIDLLFRALLDPGDVIVDSTPTFGMYPFTAHVCGGTTLNVERDEHFEVDVEAVLREAAEPRVKAIVLASPNNPTANATPLADIERLLASERMGHHRRGVPRVWREHRRQTRSGAPQLGHHADDEQVGGARRTARRVWADGA